MELTDFLLARIAEDEAVARAAAVRPIVASESGASPLRPQPSVDAIRVVWYRHDDGWTPSASGEFQAGQALYARWDPARVLAECEAKRRIIAEYRHEWDPDPINPVLLLLTLPYASHPDYREEWRR